MAKKHCWIRNLAFTKVTGFRAVCLNCGEPREGSLRGGVCIGYKKPEEAGK